MSEYEGFKLGPALLKLFFGLPAETNSIKTSKGVNPPTDRKVYKTLSMGAQQPLRLIGTITQASSAAPVLTAVFNTLTPTADGTDLVLTRANAGDYVGTLAGAFAGTVIDRVVPIIDVATGGITGVMRIAKIDDDSISIKTYDTGGPTLGDDLLTDFPIEIEVIEDPTSDIEYE